MNKKIIFTLVKLEKFLLVKKIFTKNEQKTALPTQICITDNMSNCITNEICIIDINLYNRQLKKKINYFF